MLRWAHGIVLVLAGWMTLVGGGLGCTPGSSRPTPSEASAGSRSALDRSGRPAASASSSPASPPDASTQAPPVDTRPRSVSERLADAALETRIRRALVDRRALRVFDFDPQAVGGRVRLRGNVATLEQRRQAARIARSVRGIDSLTNEVTVQGNDPTEAATTSNARAGPVESDTSRDASVLYYTVEAGDTLWNIARDHRASVQRIKDLNDLTSGDLRPGERIRVR